MTPVSQTKDSCLTVIHLQTPEKTVRTGQTCSDNSFSMTPELSAVLQFRACWGRGYLQGLPCHPVLLQHYLVSFWTHVDLWLLQCSVIMLNYAKLLFWTGCMITWCLLDLVLGKWAIIYHHLDCQSSFYRSLLCLSSAILPPPLPRVRLPV